MARALSIIAATVFALASTSQVRAQVPGEVVTVVDPIDVPPERDPLAHAWDQPGDKGGFYLRPSVGLGVQNTRLGPAPWKDDLGGASVNGFATGYGLDIGGFVQPWLALHLDAHVGVLWSGDIENDTRNLGGGNDSARIIAYGLAPAATFFAPHGFYFKPAFGVGFATVKAGDTDTSNPGFFMDLVAGKDLYTDRNFSVGLQFEIVYMRLNGIEWSDGANAVDEARVRQFLFGLSFGFDSY